MASSSSSNSALIQQLDQKSRDLTAKIVAHLKSQGNFDELRRDCLEELDKMEAFRQLNQRVESYVATFLSKQEWSESLSKNQIRDNLRKHVCASDALKSGAQRLVSQVLEKKSKSFQTRLEGVVQNYIYMEKEKPQHSRYQNRSEHSRAIDKSEAVKTSTTGKTSETISDIDDIISQISGPKESPPTTKIEGSAFMKSEFKEAVHPSTSMHHRSDSSFSKQQAAGSLPKNESSRFERKGDSSPIDVPKSTPSSKTIMGAKKFNPSKRVTPKTTISQSTGNASEKTADSSINARTKTIHSKPSSSPKSHSPKVESPRDSTDIEKPVTRMPENVASLKADIHRTSPISNVSKGLHEKSKCSEVVVGLHARQKVEDKYIDSSKSVQESIKPVEVESKVEEKPSVETHLKKDLQEKTTKDPPLLEPQVELSRTDVASSGDDDVKDMANKHSLPEDLESDIESDVSDVSSVHTSDLSSFDGEISSDSYHSDDDDDARKGTKRGTSQSKGESKRKWDHSPGSGKGESTRERKNMNRSKSKGTKMQSQMQKSGTSTTDTTTKRKRGRPRKDRSETENRQRRDLKQDRSKQQQEEQADKESSDGMPTRDRSKRPIKKRRCYSPSSEGSREVCLPSKRSRVSSKD